MLPEEFIKDMIVDTWQSKVKQATLLFDGLPDLGLNTRTSPIGYKVTYIIGHLVAANDQLLELMRLGNRLYPELDDLFMIGKIREQPYPDHIKLREQWTIINAELDHHFSLLEMTHWLSRHQNVSENEFRNQPHRNVLSILLNRIAHLSYHIGQLTLLIQRIGI